jgi:uncharacterized protein (TIGR03084 family)
MTDAAPAESRAQHYGRPSIEQLCDDLTFETVILDRLVGPLDDAGWNTPTPSVGWTILDQIVHLARTDEMARLSVDDPDRFVELRQLIQRDPLAYRERLSFEDAARSEIEVLGWWHDERAKLTSSVRRVDPGIRVPWFGPAMSVRSAVTARIMETWAHGQDCFDALQARHRPSHVLRHVAFIGVQAFANSYRSKGRPVPDTKIRVELDSPERSQWFFGPSDAAQVVTGTAEDFSLVVTQRRHVNDTGILTRGDVAAEWMTIAQAFAGPGGAGRRPGQFSHHAPG